MKRYNTKVIIGAQWGDEGKGKISDFLAQSADVVVRFQGGNNAGHTIIFNDDKYVLQHIPSGIFNPKTLNIMAQGMVINPKTLIKEIDNLEKKGIINYQLFISDKAHVILPYHLDIDISIEKLKASIKPKNMIGTTKKGIGPAYEDKYARTGIRFNEFINEKAFLQKLKNTLIIKNKFLTGLGLKKYKTKDIFNEYKKYAKILKNRVVETGSLLSKLANQNKRIIFEGAQGAMLCIENGTYPYVTSSSPTASSVPLGAGISPKYIFTTIGVVKAYTTRVGEGALPTEIKNKKIKEYIRNAGKEFGTVTSRPRRIGWLDTVVLKHSARVAGLTEIAITLLDVFDNLSTIKIGYTYEKNGREIKHIPSSNEEYNSYKAKYIEMPGWKTSISKTTSLEDLPKEARNYILKIEELVGVKVSMFSVGPDRKQTIYIKK